MRTARLVASTGKTVPGDHPHPSDFLSCLQGCRNRVERTEVFGCKVTNEKETRAMGIEIGDFIALTRTVVTETGFIKSRHLMTRRGNSANLLRVYKEGGN